MSPKPFVVQPDDRSDPLHVVASDKIWVLASKDATQGYEVFCRKVNPIPAPGLIRMIGTRHFLSSKVI